ncbi:bacillithiol biosynthesis cysteine-adding enzyme BshC [Bacillus sp. MUM 13]|uniref:bacillithiol biosynthesis cysteine-adding enzyme BshC n=1 Tax=Bacillus sp. MUM 13 TaxID=1678001 RepID=UPI0008F5BCE4|nr:bacillithiol biosynthesis cysteine-adding enzyme BshC [Bacillus sp. MUM 13]OIK15186.1 bacillithiol biosynthesis cysteine-adding enzyme BshC [Bacillus sp. MUM 13]
MEMKDLALPSLNRFASDYLEGNLTLEDYFHYSVSSKGSFSRRYNELMNRSFCRMELATYIQQYMARFPLSDKAARNIEDLKNETSVVVVGGQQAGLLSGPLYTIHKVISIIKLAAEQEKEINARVIPLFWIAGEDHDLAEVNHVYTLKNQKPEKKTYPLYHPFKSAVTDVELDLETAYAWMEEIVETYGETDFTNKLLADMKGILQQSNTFADFFAALIHEWFSEYGLLMIDAGDPSLRKIESEYFGQIITNTRNITEAVLSQQSFMQEQGYNRAIEMDPSAANLFYYDRDKKERTLLEFDGDTFYGKNGEVSFSYGELLSIAENEPEKLSNNVVTRPLMQEMLLPVLAFISGPGEIAYWAELKRVFDLFSMKMPLIMPRLNITILERGIWTDMKDTGLDLETVLTEGADASMEAFLESVKDDEAWLQYELTKKQLAENHHLLSEKAMEIDRGLAPLMEKNRLYLERQLDFIYGKIVDSTRRNHSVSVNKYQRITNSLYPLGSPQERIWNIFYYLNKYGPDFIKEIMELPYEFNNQHKVIFI